MVCLSVILAIFLSLCNSNNVSGANILAIVPTPSYSHQIAFWPIWKALLKRGHQLTLITTDPDNTLQNITQIDIGDTYDIMRKYDITTNVTKNNNNFFAMMDLYIKLGLELQESVLSHEGFQNLLKNESASFDIILSESWNLPILSVVHRFNAPFIAISSIDATMQAHECIGNPTHPVLYPEMILPFTGDLNFFERLLSTSYNLYSRYITNKINAYSEQLIEKYVGVGYPSIWELLCKMDMLFINANPIFNSVRPLVPGTINIGGALHIQDEKPLSKDLQEYLDSANEGVIYFSLGSNVKSKDLSQEMRKVLIETFSELPYKILWKFEADEFPEKPSNVKLAKWLPQQDVLRHPNIKLFITQGGLQSIDEAIFNRIPMVGIPFFGDQQNNIKKLAHKGIAIYIDHFTIEKNSFKAAILEVINNPKYRNTMRELADLALDQPMTGVEKAVWWTEYVIRHKGAKHLRSPAADIPLYQYFLLDVIGTVAGVCLVLSYLLYKTAKCTLRALKKLMSSEAIKKKSKRKPKRE